MDKEILKVLFKIQDRLTIIAVCLVILTLLVAFAVYVLVAEGVRVHF